MIRVLFILYIISACMSCSPIKKFNRQANHKTEKGDLESARALYLKAYQLDSNNYKANAELGIVLSEYMARYEEALPYLQKAEKLSSKDTLAELFYNLGKSYQYMEAFDKALLNFNKMKRFDDLEEDNKWFKMDLEKRIEDCHYAKSHTELVNAKEYYVVNVGSKINTTAPEYVPTLNNNNEMIFTSKRKDYKKEKINPEDGKYFESMYLTTINPNGFSEPRLFNIPNADIKSNYIKGHESIVSISPNGNKVFTFHNGKLYESTSVQDANAPKKLSKKVNVDYYQNHAYLTKDEKALYFTSEQAKGGVGGNDIYKVTKNEDGTWGEPENLGMTINTARDEDAPFVTEDGKTLYFASNGHPGYGNYDIYKSTYENGSWTQPINLGKPLNTVANDIFLTNTADSKFGYFSSNRRGGKGDLDIYKINFNPTSDAPCASTDNELITINTLDTNPTDYIQELSFNVDESISNKIIDYSWTVAGDTNIAKQNPIEFNFKDNGSYPVILKMVAYCDTCLSPLVLCKQIMVDYKRHPIDPLPPKDLDITRLPSGTQLTKEQLVNLGFDVTPIYFDFNKSVIKEDASKLLDKNSLVLAKYPMLSVIIEGNTDARASASYNLKLSKDRALATQQYLLKKGITKKRLEEIRAKGKSQLVNNCLDNSCDDSLHQLNRRVELIIIKK